MCNSNWTLIQITSYQIERIKRDPVLSQLYGNFRTNGAEGKQYLMISQTKRGFLRWIDQINPQNVDAKQLKN